MPLSPWACTNCGFWQVYFASPPSCPVCADARNDLPADGWDFRSEAEIGATHSGSWKEYAPNLWGYKTHPNLGLAGTGWLIVRPEGNIAFEAAPYYTPPMLEHIRALGGIRYLAASHAHGYGALFQLQRDCNPDSLAIQRDDLVMTKAMNVTTPFDDRLELAPGYTLHHVGGHYAGQAALHDAHSRRLFCGDMFKVDQDAQGVSHAISMHKAFHKNIPLTHGELRKYRDVIAPLAFDSLCTPFEYAPEVNRDMAIAVLDEALARPPAVKRIPI